MEQNEAHYSTLDDVAIVAAIAAGEEAALAAFFDRYASLVLGLCFRILKDRTLAEEVLDDVFWELWNRSDRYGPGRSSPRTYLLMMTRSRAIDRLRSERKNREGSPHTIDRSGDPVASHQPSSDHGPLKTVVNQELRQHVTTAMQSLDLPRRQVLELAFFEGLSHSDIARHLDQPLGTVKTRIRKGLLHLREALRTYYNKDRL